MDGLIHLRPSIPDRARSPGVPKSAAMRRADVAIVQHYFEQRLQPKKLGPRSSTQKNAQRTHVRPLAGCAGATRKVHFNKTWPGSHQLLTTSNSIWRKSGNTPDSLQIAIEAAILDVILLILSNIIYELNHYSPLLFREFSNLGSISIRCLRTQAICSAWTG